MIGIPTKRAIDATNVHKITMTEIGVLTIHVKRAEGLKAMDLNGKSDPYVRVHGLHQVAETAVHPKTLDPNFDETLELYGDKGGFARRGSCCASSTVTGARRTTRWAR